MSQIVKATKKNSGYTESVYTNMHSLPREMERWSSKAACSQEACQMTSWAVLCTGTHSEKLLSCLIFFLFVWTLSLCAVCHTAMLKVQWGMFSPSSSDSGCSVPRITHCSQSFISHLHFIFGTHHKNMKWIHVSVKTLKTASCQGLN